MITPGVLLIERDALRPRCFEVEAGSHPDSWMPLNHALYPQQLEKELSGAGWTFFFMAGTIRATAFGFDRDKTVRAALNRCIKAVSQQRCNCLQIESVEMHSFLGIPYVRLSVRPRHIQKGMLFADRAAGDAVNIKPHDLRRNVAAT
jgi:hypothetical protein